MNSAPLCVPTRSTPATPTSLPCQTQSPPTPPDIGAEDRQVDQRIRETLDRAHYSALRRLHCDFHEGMAILQGELPSFYLVQVAQTLIASLPQVERIENHIQVTARK